MQKVNVSVVVEQLAAMIYLEKPKYVPESKSPGKESLPFPFEKLDDEAKKRYRLIAFKILDHLNKLCYELVPVKPVDLTKKVLSSQEVYNRKLDIITSIVVKFKKELKPDLRNLSLIPWEEIAKRVCDSQIGRAHV